MNKKYFLILLPLILVVLAVVYYSKKEPFKLKGADNKFINILAADQDGNISVISRPEMEKSLTDFETGVNTNFTNLSNTVNTEKTRAKKAEDDLKTKVDAEKTRAKKAENDLETAINTKADASTVYTKTKVDDKLKKKQNTGTYVVKGQSYRIYAADGRDTLLYMPTDDWRRVKGSGNASTNGPGYIFRII